MDKQLIIRLDPELKERLMKVARRDGKTASQVVREIIESYVTDRDFGARVADLWSRIGDKLKQRGTTAADVDDAIRAVRAKK
jgi:predicted DNA-binding protein